MDHFDEADLHEEDVPASAVPFVRGKPMTVQEFGIWVKALRDEKGLTLATLSEQSGYSTPHLSQIETGKRKRHPSPELLQKLYKPLGVDYSAMLMLAGYTDLAQGVKLREAQEVFSDDSPTELLRLREEVKSLEQIKDLKVFLERHSAPLPTYNGHKLSPQDRKRIFVILEQLFPEYQKPE